MANARLKQARRRGSVRSSQAAQSVPQSSAQTQTPLTNSPDASVAHNEPISNAQREREALEAALTQRKHALESEIQALTLGKPLHKETEPGCDASGRRLARCHRDFLLQEMEWMAADFSQERKWRVRNAKMLSQTLVSHLDRQEQRLARRKKSEEVQRRRTAARVGRDVKKFWFKIDKIIAFKVKLQADELRQRHMQKHLKQLVEQTEKYSTALAKSFQEAQEVKKEEEQDDEDRDDGDFEMIEEEEDDETTIEEEERRAGPVSRRQAAAEVTALQEEGEMSIEELRARYAAMENDTDADEGVENTVENSSEDDDFELTEEEEDDETTIAAEERRSGPVSRRQAAAEVATLQEENELSIEELRARYADALGTDGDEIPEADEEADVEGGSDGDDDTGDGDFVLTSREEAEQEDDETTIEEEEKLEGDVSPSQRAEELRLLEEEGQMSVEQLRARYASAASDEEQSGDHKNLGIKPDGERDAVVTNREQEHHDDDETKDDVDGTTISDNTPTDHLLTRRSGYKRPYLLTSRLDLREYQEAGVNWLISMCERRINGILADEMGLGKTIQTISLLAHLACAQGLWGPHLIVVPTSCLVNWEMEFKRWCPAFKVLTYFGSAKRRKELRQGWSKQNAFQVCITSYQLVVQDAHCFKRKKWYYLILDEAHNIKNWKSLRWQTLLTFSSQRRLLLTGTPLQNNLLELWALMHFLMPHVFASRKEFSYWFQNPLALMVENGSDPTQSGDNGVEGGKDLVTQLHGIIRPFVLRRLKKDVAKQLPGKFEHVISCQLSKRQRFLYEDFISRSSTRRAMFGRGKGRGANFMSMMNVLMQLRKVCNHPDLFEPRPIESPLDMASIQVPMPSRCGYLVDELVNERPRVALWSGLNLPGLEVSLSEKSSSMRRRELFFYDVGAPLPDDTVATVPPAYEEKKDIVRRIMILAAKRREYWEQKRLSVSQLQKIHVGLYLDEPVFGDALIRKCTMPTFISSAMQVHVHRAEPIIGAREPTQALQAMVRDPEERVASLQAVVNKAVCYVPKARANPARVIYGGGGFVYDDNFVLSRKTQVENLEANCVQPVASQILAPYYNSFKRTQLFFPDKALVQFDCGKLQQLAVLLRKLKRGGHRCLIFTQMSSMLNILEVFLNLHGHTYFRLDGATKVDKRQMLMERFNRDDKVFCFILSTRSGGLGINLTGADSVIFYDSDWNPAMDAQAQDRAHRIGQTRDVHIYRLVSEHTVEENILRKAQQKRHLDFLVMSEGQFTTDFFSKASLRELMMSSADEEPEHIESESDLENVGSDEDMDDDNEVSFDTVENAMAQVEDEEDVVAMKGARAEYLQEQNEFDEDAGGANSVASPMKQAKVAHSGGDMPSTPSSVVSTATSERGNDEDDEFRDDDTVEEDVDEEVIDRSTRRGTRHELAKHDGSDSDSVDDGDPKSAKPSRKRHRRSSKDQRKTVKRVKRLGSHDDNGKRSDKVRERARDAAEEQKLQAWKASVQSLQGFEDSLNPVDRYALHFREDVDPLYAYTPAQQAEALAGVDSNPDALTLLEDIEQTEAEKREEESRLIAEGELVVGQMEDIEDGDPEQMTAHYTELYRRERAHVLFERRKRLLTGAAWSRMKCVNTGHPFYFNVDTREAAWECPPVWVANEQLKSAQERGYEGLPPSVLQRVMSLLVSYPERYRAQMVCRSWYTAAQHPSLFVKVSASDFDPGSPETLAKMLAKVVQGDTVLFGAGVYQLDETLEISKPLRLMAAPDSRVELQMHSCRAQLRWSAKGGVICGFHFSRTSSAPDAAARDINLSSDVKEPVAIVKQSRKSLRKQDRKLANWQHLLSVVGEGQVRVEYCEFDGNGRGNACVCVWGRAEKRKKRKKKRSRGSSSSFPATSNPATPLVGVSVPSTPTAATPRVSAAPTSALAPVKINSVSISPVTSASAVPPASTATTAATTVAATKQVITTSAGMRPPVSNPVSTITRISAPGVSTPIVPKAQTPISSSVPSTPQGIRIATTPVATPTATVTKPAADTLLVLQNCRIRGAGTSGVLLVRGSLVMSLNTVEGNSHSGVTVLGGHAILRRNKIQRNGRFGMRLLYHAGNVIVEDNVVSGHSCGNLDVDNSGRRFVVRLNDMDKRKKLSEKLPHSHGKLRLKTYRIVEKEVPRPVVNSITTPTSAMNEYWKRQLTGAGATTATTTTTAAAATSARPVVTTNGTMAGGIPFGFMRPVVFPQGSNPLSRLPMTFAPLSKATIPSMTLNRTTSVQLPATATALQRTVSVPAAARPVTLPGTTRPTIPGTYVTSTTSGTTPSGSSALEPLKKRRKRRPKSQQVIVGGREIVVCDTCEKPTEKVVKPRRPKDPQTPTVLQQLTSPSALQLKFAPGSTAAAVAAAMSAMMANTAKLQAAASSAAQLQASSSTLTSVRVPVPKPSVPVSFAGSSTPVGMSTKPATGATNAVTAKSLTGATLATNTVTSKPAATVMGTSSADINRTVSVGASGSQPRLTSRSGAVTPANAVSTVMSTATPVAAKLPRSVSTIQPSSIATATTGSEPTRASAQLGEKRKLEATGFEAKATDTKTKSVDSCKDPETNASKS